MSFDFTTATIINESKPVTQPTNTEKLGEGQEAQPQQSGTQQPRTLETPIAFDWGSARPYTQKVLEPSQNVDDDVVLKDVEGVQKGFEIGPADQKPFDFVEGFRKTIKDVGLTGPIPKAFEAGSSIIEKTGVGKEDREKQRIARSQAIYSLSEASGLSMNEVSRGFDDLVRDPRMTGIKGDFSSPVDVLEMAMMMSAPLAFAAAPMATIKGVMLFGALDKLIPTEKLLSEDASRSERETLKMVDFVAKGALTAGLYKNFDKGINQVIERFTLNKLEQYKLPTEIRLSSKQVSDIWQTGKLTSAEQKDLFSSLNLDNVNIKAAIKNGVTIRVPAQKITRITGKPYFEKIRAFFGKEPINSTVTQTAGEIVKGPRGLLPAPDHAKIVAQGGGIFIGYEPPILSKSGKVLGNNVYFNSPTTGSTLLIKLEKLTPELVREKIAESDAKFAAAVEENTRKFAEDSRSKGSEPDIAESDNMSVKNSKKYESSFLDTRTGEVINTGSFHDITKLSTEQRSLVELQEGENIPNYKREIRDGFTDRKTGEFIERDDLQAKFEAEAAQEENFSPKGKAKPKAENRTRSGEAEGFQREVDPKDAKAFLKTKLGQFDEFHSIEVPELLKIAKFLSGEDVKAKKSLGGAFGKFLHIDGVKGWIEIKKTMFSDPALVQGVLAHEIGHLADWIPDKTLLRGNILGRLSSVLGYKANFLPEKPGAQGPLLPKDRARIKREAEKIAAERKGVKQAGDGNMFEPDQVLAIWNAINLDGVPPHLVEYVKRLDAAEKKSIVKAALEARKKGEKVTINDMRDFMKKFDEDPESVAKIYEDLIKAEIEKRNLFDRETIMDEMKALTKWWHPFNESQVPKAYVDYRFNTKELYAEFVSVLLNAPAKAKEIAPKSYEAFWNYIGNKPEVMQTLIDTQALIQGSNGELYKQRGKDIASMFETGEQMFRARQLRYEKAKKSVWFHVKNMFWDKNTSILEKLPEIRKADAEAGRPLSIHHDPKYILEKNDFGTSIVKSYIEKLQPVFEEIQAGKYMQDIDTLMFAKRVAGDRKEFANPLGHNPKTAQAQLDFMKENDPDRFQKVEALVDKIQDWFKNEINPLMRDIYTPEQMAMVDGNDSYAPFRVVDFMKDYVASGIIAQTGTIREIASPFTALVMKATSMVSAATRNKIKKDIGAFLIEHPDFFELQKAKVTNFFDGKRNVFNIEQPSDKNLGVMSWRENGEWKAFHVDRHIADMFNHNDNGFLMMAGQTIDKLLLNNAIFRPMWITFNITFQARNLFRDFTRTWKAHPEMTLVKTLVAMKKAMPHAIKKVKGEYDQVINEMYKNGALGVTLNDLILGQSSDETELNAVLSKFDIVPGKESKFKKIPIMKEIVQILDGIRFVGDVIETTPKVAGWQTLSKLPIDKRAYFTRNLIGTPNYKRAGTLKPISNSVLLFSNIIKEGYRGMYELSTDPELRGQYWKKTFFVNILSKLMIKAAMLGVFGVTMQQAYEKMTEYDKANYIPIPLGINEAGEVQYLRIPQDEDGRLIGALVWKTMNGFEDPKGAIEDIFDFTAGQLPTPSPAFDILSQWATWASGETPRDEFRQRDILTRDQRLAGGMDAFEPMALWTMNQTGMSGFEIYDRMKDQTTWKKAIALTPIVKSFYRETNYGEQEQLQKALREVQADESRDRLKLAKDLERDPQGTMAELENSKLNQVTRKITREEVRKGTDPIARVLLQATSNNQKRAVLNAAFDQFTAPKELQIYLNELVEKKVVSQDVADMALQDFDEKKRSEKKRG